VPGDTNLILMMVEKLKKNFYDDIALRPVSSEPIERLYDKLID
jgi:hypothetical protein